MRITIEDIHQLRKRFACSGIADLLNRCGSDGPRSDVIDARTYNF